MSVYRSGIDLATFKYMHDKPTNNKDLPLNHPHIQREFCFLNRSVVVSARDMK